MLKNLSRSKCKIMASIVYKSGSASLAEEGGQHHVACLGTCISLVLHDWLVRLCLACITLELRLAQHTQVSRDWCTPVQADHETDI